MSSPSAGAWWQEHVGHELKIEKVKGYSPVWGEGEGYELYCIDCNCLLDEFAPVENDPCDICEQMECEGCDNA